MKPPVQNSSFYAKLNLYIRRVEYRPAIKAGIAAAASLWLGVGLAKFLGRPNSLLSGTWSVLSTFIVLQTHLGGTYKAAGVRFLGVLVGSFMGSAFTMFFGSNLFTLGVSVALTVCLCSLVNLKDSIRIACMSVSIILILWGLHPSMSPWQFGLYRLTDSTVGILTALLVSRGLWPTQAMDTLRSHIAKILASQGRLFQLLTSFQELPKSYTKIVRRLEQQITTLLEENKGFLAESRLELFTEAGNIELWSLLQAHLTTIFDHVLAMEIFHNNQIVKILDKKLTTQLETTANHTVEAFKNFKKMAERWEVFEQNHYIEETIFRLNEELSRFRDTRATRKYERRDVEQFFVFFFHLKSILEELRRFEEQLIELIGEQQ